ncbi:hypothetical protein [Clostridium thermosuccinogenes]|uniref:hypothetical protein n=1 Tax=Clostridium thermosuccinogenes TaxID=84032 RepID=UPI000CCBE100|nr:hypothetical protein [Pseudoclostridium thermosuccinogenes]PNT91550.1 hypothetical protein CDQ83_17405 [Pseudoclostridium thermosuccinogenes]
MSYTKDKLTMLDKITTLVIILGPMFTQYASVIDIILLPELFLFPLILIYILRNRSLQIWNIKGYFPYLFIVLVLTLLNILIGTNVNISVSLSAFIRHAFYAFVIVTIGRKNFNIDFAAKTIVSVALINAVYGVIQYISYHFFGRILPWYFGFLPIKYGTYLIENQSYYFSNFGFRFSGLFSEPAHFSQYIAIALVVTLFYKSESFRIKRISMVLLSILFIFVLLLNGSGTGFAMVLFVLSIVVVNLRGKKLTTVLLKYSLITLAVFAIVYISTSNALSMGLERILSTSELSSSNIRIFRPFFIFSNLPFFNKIFGVGYANYSEYVINSPLATSYELSMKSAWTNTIGYILVGSGFVGMLFYLRFYIHLLKKTKEFFRYLTLLLGLFAIFTEVPLSFQFITIMGFLSNGITTKSLVSCSKL